MPFSKNDGGDDEEAMENLAWPPVVAHRPSGLADLVVASLGTLKSTQTLRGVRVALVSGLRTLK